MNSSHYSIINICLNFPIHQLYFQYPANFFLLCPRISSPSLSPSPTPVSNKQNNIAHTFPSLVYHPSARPPVRSFPPPSGTNGTSPLSPPPLAPFHRASHPTPASTASEPSFPHRCLPGLSLRWVRPPSTEPPTAWREANSAAARGSATWESAPWREDCCSSAAEWRSAGSTSMTWSSGRCIADRTFRSSSARQAGFPPWGGVAFLENGARERRNASCPAF